MSSIDIAQIKSILSLLKEDVKPNCFGISKMFQEVSAFLFSFHQSAIAGKLSRNVAMQNFYCLSTKGLLSIVRNG